MDLEGKVAVVTGGTKGIGRAIAEHLVNAGSRVLLSARSSHELEISVRELNARAAGRVAGKICDVQDYEQVGSVFKDVVTRFGGLDILVNNAGIGIFGSVESMPPSDFENVLRTNLFGVFYCCHEAIPLMKKRGGGYIVNVSSLAGVNPHPSMAAYNASKFGLNGFSEALMQEVRHDGIKVSYIMPGSVNTSFGGDTPSEDKAWQLTPDDIAETVLDLLRHDKRSLVSRVEIRPSRPPKK
jgi:NAD(P)-dependent dehydrogenase (short-subunit alcohol dehydrogenase family)